MSRRWIRLILLAVSLAGATGTMAGESLHLPDSRWSGFYFGAHIAHHDIKTSGLFDGTGEPAGPFWLDRIGDQGMHGGIHAGYSKQWQRFVLGLEADFAPGGFARSGLTVQDGTATEAGLLSYPLRGELDYLATARVRAGITASSDVLFYATAGAAFTRFEMDIANGRSRVGFNATGLAFGGGAEIALSHNISVRAEWLRLNFDKGLRFTDVATSGIFDANDGDHLRLSHIDLARVALTIKIGP